MITPNTWYKKLLYLLFLGTYFGCFNTYTSLFVNYEFPKVPGRMRDKLNVCQKGFDRWDPKIPVIYAITPTYARPVQKAELTRLSQTFRCVKNFHWIVIEDSPNKTALVQNLLARANLNYTHLKAETPSLPSKLQEKKKLNSMSGWKKKHRGIEQRNTALRWLRKNRRMNDEGVVYFADDDNAYSLKLFDEMRFTKEVSVWPVGLVGGLEFEKPIVNLTTGKIARWRSAWRTDRAFPIDMAGFAISLQRILKKFAAFFSYTVPTGCLESNLLGQLTTRHHLEPKANNCTQVLVWHTRTKAPLLHEERKLNSKGIHSDTGIEV